MNIRILGAVTMMAAAAVFALPSCDDGTVTPMAPELGEIAVSQEKIGVGHQIVLTVEDKVPMSGNLYSMDPVWTVNGSEIMDIYTSYEFTGGMGRYTCIWHPMPDSSMWRSISRCVSTMPLQERMSRLLLHPRHSRWFRAMRVTLSGVIR